MYRISIQSVGHGNRIEWIEDLDAGTRKGARGKATKWLRKMVCESDYESIYKFSVSDYEDSEVWQLI